MSTENNARRVIRTVAALIQGALADLGRPAARKQTRPKLESRNGYAMRMPANVSLPAHPMSIGHARPAHDRLRLARARAKAYTSKHAGNAA